jgi:hypothetical protein
MDTGMLALTVFHLAGQGVSRRCSMARDVLCYDYSFQNQPGAKHCRNIFRVKN